ncbi:MAG: hypothetical protein WBA74_00795 [Cyclobacteriaceae bacterium]
MKRRSRFHCIVLFGMLLIDIHINSRINQEKQFITVDNSLIDDYLKSRLLPGSGDFYESPQEIIERKARRYRISRLS